MGWFWYWILSHSSKHNLKIDPNIFNFMHNFDACYVWWNYKKNATNSCQNHDFCAWNNRYFDELNHLIILLSIVVRMFSILYTVSKYYLNWYVLYLCMCMLHLFHPMNHLYSQSMILNRCHYVQINIDVMMNIDNIYLLCMSCNGYNTKHTNCSWWVTCVLLSQFKTRSCESVQTVQAMQHTPMQADAVNATNATNSPPMHPIHLQCNQFTFNAVNSVKKTWSNVFLPYIRCILNFVSWIALEFEFGYI